MVKDLDFQIDLHHRGRKLAFVWASRKLFHRLESTAEESHINLEAIAIAGYQSVLYRGVPILWDQSLSDHRFIVVEATLLDALKKAEAGNGSK